MSANLPPYLLDSQYVVSHNTLQQFTLPVRTDGSALHRPFSATRIAGGRNTCSIENQFAVLPCPAHCCEAKRQSPSVTSRVRRLGGGYRIPLASRKGESNKQAIQNNNFRVSGNHLLGSSVILRSSARTTERGVGECLRYQHSTEDRGRFSPCTRQWRSSYGSQVRHAFGLAGG